MLYISRIQIRNIRCFADIDISFDLEGGRPPWTTIVGDNATGKTALLRSVAIGICDESSAAGLLKESEEGYIRRGATGKAKIIIHLKGKHQSRKEYRIETTIEKIPFQNGTRKGNNYEKVRQKTYPPSRVFPWGKIFACAYGAGRGTIGTGDIAGYSVINAVYNMFNYHEGLQNPELTIRRKRKNVYERKMFKILTDLMPKTENIHLTRSGVTADGPWGSHMPLRDLADGYKSTFLWVTDFLGWALSYYTNIQKGSDISGIVLIDEIEQHLHPKWQRTVVHSLKRVFPNVQFITTTHSPLVALSVGELISGESKDKLVHLELKEKNIVIKYELNKHELEMMKGLEYDQMLASRAFDYQIGADPEVEKVLVEASKLAGKGEKRTPKESKRYQEVKNILKRIMQPDGRTLFERQTQEDLYQEIKKNIRELEKILFEEKYDKD